MRYLKYCARPLVCSENIETRSRIQVCADGGVYQSTVVNTIYYLYKVQREAYCVPRASRTCTNTDTVAYSRTQRTHTHTHTHTSPQYTHTHTHTHTQMNSKIFAHLSKSTHIFLCSCPSTDCRADCKSCISSGGAGLACTAK